MDEREKVVNQVPVDLDDLFSGDTIITIEIKGIKTRFAFREKDAETDLEYQRRLSKFGGAGLKVKPTDVSLQADLWLFDRLCKKVEVIDGDRSVDVPDFKARLSPDMKRTAYFEYQQRIVRGVEGGEGNS